MFRQPFSFNTSQISWQQFRQKFWEWRGIWIITPTMAGLVLALRFTGLLQSLEWATLDEFFRRRPPEPPDPSIVIVGFNETDIAALGSATLSDQVLARLLQQIKQQQPRAIGLDLYRNIPVEPGHAALTEVFSTTSNLIGIEKVIGGEGTLPIPPPPVLSELGQVGINDVVPDTDGKIRRGVLFLFPADREEALEGLGMKLARIYLEAEGITPPEDRPYLELGKAAFLPFQANDGGYVRADDAGYQVLLNFRGGAGSFQTVSVMDVLEHRVDPDLMRDRLVLIGPMADSLKDFFYTPYSSNWTDTPQQTAGVELQATIASQLIRSALDNRPLIRVWSDPIEALWILAWSGVGATLGWIFRAVRGSTISVLLSGSALVGSAFLAFLSGWWIPVVPAALALVAAGVVMTRYIAVLEHEERQTIMNLFGRHVAPEVAEAIWRDRHQILSQGRAQGQQLTATVLFTDIRDFSRIAEQMPAEELMVWLNEYMEAMAQTVFDHGGVIDKFIGDAVMAVFGVPIPHTTEAAIAKDAVQAVNCAMAMATRLRSLNQQWQAQNRPIAAMRIGISTGKVVSGSLGSSQRLDYTTIGDNVNVAARLESYDKSLSHDLCRILISEETYHLSQGHYQAQFIGDVLLKGRQQSVRVYQVLVDPVKQN